MNPLDAILRGDASALEKLGPAEVNARDGNGFTLLMNAVLEGGTDPGVTKTLLERGADVNAVEPLERWTALHFAARGQNEAMVKALLDGGAEIDPVDVFGNTPLWRAVMSTSAPNFALIRTLLGRGADPCHKNHHDSSPIDIARRSGNQELVVLLEGASP